MLSLVSSLGHGVVNALDVLFSAARVTGAIESGRTPALRDLDRLGIEAAAFAAIHRA